MGASVSPEPLSDHDLYDQFRDKGLSHADAVKHVELRRAILAQSAPQPPAGPTALTAALASGAQGATSGFADELMGAMQAIRDPNIPLTRAAMDSSIGATREQFNAARLAHPGIAIAANLIGSSMNPLARLLGPMTANMGRVATGAVGGAFLGGAQGVGEGSGSLSDRATAGAIGAGAGGAIGAIGAFMLGKSVPEARQFWRNLVGAFAKTEQKVVQKLGKNVSPETLQNVMETAHRAYLQKQGFTPHDIDQLMETWRAEGQLPKRPPFAPPAPTASRVGETITPLEPQLPTLRAQADVMATQPAYVRAGNPMNLPTGTGPMAPPAPGMPLGVPGTLQALEQQFGRPLTPPETQSVLERLLGPMGGLPRSYGRRP